MIGDKTKPEQTRLSPRPVPAMNIGRWPTERWPEGVGLSFKDGWNFGVGFGLAMAIAVPIILCIIFFAVSIFGTGLLGALL